MNQLKTAFLLVALTVRLVLIGRVAFGDGGTILFLGIAIVMNGVAYWFSDKIALAAAQAREVAPQEAPMLYRLADRLAVQYGVPRPRVYVSPDPSPNAFATGRNPSHAAICVNEGLLRILDEEELYGVLAHEFGHVKNRDILISSVVARQTGKPAFAHLYIVNPLCGQSWAGLFSTHPPIEERIRRLEEMAGGIRRAS